MLRLVLVFLVFFFVVLRFSYYFLRFSWYFLDFSGYVFVFVLSISYVFLMFLLVFRLRYQFEILLGVICSHQASIIVPYGSYLSALNKRIALSFTGRGGMREALRI